MRHGEIPTSLEFSQRQTTFQINIRGFGKDEGQLIESGEILADPCVIALFLRHIASLLFFEEIRQT
jgi:hypothetical protein